MQPILLVDDDPMILSGLQMLLELETIPSHIATDAPMAEAMIAAQFYPIILSDLRLRSEDDGLQLMEHVRRISPRSRVAAMSGYLTPEVESRALAVGATALLRKPFDSELFLSTIRSLRPPQVDFDAVYRTTAPKLRAMMYRRYGLASDQCDDVLQQAWCVLLEKRYEVLDARAWLTGTVMNLSRQMIHRITREEPIETAPDAAQTYRSDDTMTLAVRRALTRLDDRSRNLCDLIGLQELSYADAAARLDLPIGSVGPLYIRAKARLRRELEN
jgi:RNA polymerase sigma factor (sigma-70 family)